MIVSLPIERVDEAAVSVYIGLTANHGLADDLSKYYLDDGSEEILGLSLRLEPIFASQEKDLAGFVLPSKVVKDLKMSPAQLAPRIPNTSFKAQASELRVRVALVGGSSSSTWVLLGGNELGARAERGTRPVKSEPQPQHAAF